MPFDPYLRGYKPCPIRMTYAFHQPPPRSSPMTDGTTGIQVAPITEDDMSRVHSILKRAADAIVGMSQLQADVQMLRDTVSSLQADTDRLRSQNNALDEALNHSRSVRDEQSHKINALTNELFTASEDRDNAFRQRDKVEADNANLTEALEVTRKAKDDAEFRVLELEDKLASAEAKLAKVAELHRTLFPVEPETVKAPEPTTIPAFIEPKPEPEYKPWNDPVEPTSTVAEPSTPDSLDQWEPGYYWDQLTGRYWRNGVTPTKPDGEQIPF